MSAEDLLRLHQQMGAGIIDDIQSRYPDYDAKRSGILDVTMSTDSWIVTWWWDPVAGRLHARVVGDGQAAMEAFQEDGEAHRALRDGVKRQESAPWLRDMPGSNTSKRKAPKEADEPDVPTGKIAFGDLPVGWAKKNRKRKKT